MNNSDPLRSSFDSVPDLYHRARPRYPIALYDSLVQETDLSSGARLLEVGSGTGIATLPLAQKGYNITCVELGGALAEATKHNLSNYPNVNVQHAALESWDTRERFDLIYSATAWHWIDPAMRYSLASKLLKPNGFLAFWSAAHVFPTDGDKIFVELQNVYDEIGEGLPPDASWPKPGDLEEKSLEIERSGLFQPIFTQHFDWEVEYDAESYIDLLSTFSGHIAMQEWQRRKLFEAIRDRLSRRERPTLRRHWGCVLHIAQCL